MNLDPATERKLKYAACAGYVLLVMIATLTKLRPDLDPLTVVSRMDRAVHWSLHAADIVDAARNLLLFAGFGVVWILATSSRRPWADTLRVTLWGLAVSVAVETIQLLSEYRFSSINDVTTNTIGALLGALLVTLLTTMLRRSRARPSWAGIPMWCVSLPFLVAVAAEMFAPIYRHEMNPGAGGSLFARLLNALHYIRPFSLHTVSYADVALFWPAGVLAVAMLVEWGVGRRTACLASMIGGCALSVAMELAHGIAGQPIELSAIAGHTAAIAIGALVGWRFLGPLGARVQGRRRAALVLAAYALLLVGWGWRPFEPRLSVADIRIQMGYRHFIPLRVLGSSQDFFGVMEIAEQFFLYMPLGFLLAVWPLRRHGKVAHMLPALWLAAFLEAGQLLVRGRNFDVTDLLTESAAVLIAYIVARRAGYQVIGELHPVSAAPEDVMPGRVQQLPDAPPAPAARSLVRCRVLAMLEVLFGIALLYIVLTRPLLWIPPRGDLTRLGLSAIAAGAVASGVLFWRHTGERGTGLLAIVACAALAALALLWDPLRDFTVLRRGEAGARGTAELTLLLWSQLWMLLAVAIRALGRSAEKARDASTLGTRKLARGIGTEFRSRSL
ncbi:MAG TPA: VanZ family protein [Gemmatimonadaceae bacterium]|nr:VanZ family protein [Gemmatimonadaceae bacterium]